MNDRIKKLKEQATSYTWNGNGVTEELDESKFAELIALECAEICNQLSVEYYEAAVAQGIDNKPQQLALAIAQARIKGQLGVPQ